MKKFIALIAIVAFIFSCNSGDRGELVGVKGKKWHPQKPYGMTLVPGGSFIMGKSDDDFVAVDDAPTKTVTVRSFYMDETEITNSEYRQFVYWVRDSTVRLRLAIMADEMGSTPGDGGIGEFAFIDQENEEMTPYDQYMYDNYFGMGDDFYAGRKINNKVKLIWETAQYPDEFYSEVMDTMYIPIEEAYNGQRTIDVEKLKFQYTYMDIESAARDKSKKRKDFIKKEEVEIYPDTTVWIRDFNYSYNEPMHNDYFWHAAYGEYPVVGVNWNQAKAFCAWRTLYKNSYLKDRRQSHQVSSYRLPMEAEWEYAARGGLEGAKYPWGGPYTTDEKACFLANFKPTRTDYAADGALYTAEARSYVPNGYNLYNMSGNVSEWTSSSYDASSYSFVSALKPMDTNTSNPIKVVRGGSWRDPAYFLQVSTRDSEFADSARSYIGFRTVQTYTGPNVVQTARGAR